MALLRAHDLKSNSILEKHDLRTVEILAKMEAETARNMDGLEDAIRKSMKVWVLISSSTLRGRIWPKSILRVLLRRRCLKST